MAWVPIRCLIPDLLRSKGKDQQWLADNTGRKKSKISDYIHLREVPNLRTAKLIAETLDCTIDELYLWEWRQPE